MYTLSFNCGTPATDHAFALSQVELPPIQVLSFPDAGVADRANPATAAPIIRTNRRLLGSAFITVFLVYSDLGSPHSSRGIPAAVTRPPSTRPPLTSQSFRPPCP